jgi:hypothetical protein
VRADEIAGSEDQNAGNQAEHYDGWKFNNDVDRFVVRFDYIDELP